MKNAMKALKISLLILSSLYGNTILAQYSDHRNRQVDSLEQILATNPPTGVKLVEMYNSLAWGYRPDRDKAMDYARRSVAVALPLDEWSWVTNGYMLLGLHHYRSVQYDSTLFYYGKALEAAERMKDFPKRFDQRTIDDRLSVIYGNMANLYNIQSDLHMAVEYYLRALALFEKHGWRNGEANVYYNVGEMYLAMQNYEQAELNYRQFDTISREIGDSLFMALANSGLSMIELEKKDYNRALEYADAAGTYFFAHPEETDNRVVILNMLAQIHLEGYGDIDRAEEYVRQALQLTQTNEVMTVTQAATLGLHAEIHLRRGESQHGVDDLRDLLGTIHEGVRNQKTVQITRFKGLGEMEPEELRDTTLNMDNRTLIRVTMEDASAADDLFRILMGDKVEPRREFIEKHALDVKNLDV